jgi:hypothetical protein
MDFDILAQALILVGGPFRFLEGAWRRWALGGGGTLGRTVRCIVREKLRHIMGGIGAKVEIKTRLSGHLRSEKWDRTSNGANDRTLFALCNKHCRYAASFQKRRIAVTNGTRVASNRGTLLDPSVKEGK